MLTLFTSSHCSGGGVLKLSLKFRLAILVVMVTTSVRPSSGGFLISTENGTGREVGMLIKS